MPVSRNFSAHECEGISIAKQYRGSPRYLTNTKGKYRMLFSFYFKGGLVSPLYQDVNNEI